MYEVMEGGEVDGELGGCGGALDDGLVSVSERGGGHFGGLRERSAESSETSRGLCLLAGSGRGLGDFRPMAV